MRRSRILPLFVVVSVFLIAPTSGASASPSSASSASATGPVYDSDATRRLVTAMIDAHGGMARWKAAPSVSFERTMVFNDPNDPWVSIETTEQGARRSYQVWPRDGALVAYDGKHAWSVGFRRGQAKHNINLGFYFLDLPWLTQDPGVRLADGGTATLPGTGDALPTVRLTFESGVASDADSYYRLFLDRTTHRLRGIEYSVAGAPVKSPFTHVFDEMATVDGLVVPVRYHTYNPKGEAFAQHWVRDWSFHAPFDPSRLAAPEPATIED